MFRVTVLAATVIKRVSNFRSGHKQHAGAKRPKNRSSRASLICTLCTFCHQTLHTVQDRCLDHFQSEKNVKIKNCDVILNDVAKTWYTNFLISNRLIYHLKEHDQETIILKTVRRYDKYFSSYSNLKKFHSPPPGIILFL